MSQSLPQPGSGSHRVSLSPARLRFREFIGKVGSGEHTSTGLSCAEAKEAMDLILAGEVGEAQLGAFLIAHRIRRPSPQELCGMLQSYRQHGPVLTTATRAICFGVPYDGRSRTAPLLPLVALNLAAAGLPVILHGGDSMPVKYGWGLAVTHQPDHFQAAEKLVPVRDAIGKRPPVASLELLWTPHRGEHLLVSGFVHPPTETRAWQALQQAGENDLLTVKGLEGSTDLPTTRAGITARVIGERQERVLLHPRDPGIGGPDQPWMGREAWREQALAALQGSGPLAEALLWNLGAYLWFAGGFQSLEAALDQARALLAARSGEQRRQALALAT